VVASGFAFEWLFVMMGLVAGTAQAAQGMGMIVFPFAYISSAYIPVATSHLGRRKPWRHDWSGTLEIGPKCSRRKTGANDVRRALVGNGGPGPPLSVGGNP
jgi:hypothetical protein